MSCVVHPASDASALLILSTVNRAPMILALRAFQQEVDPEGWNARELLLDTAGRHRAKDLRAPPGMALLRLAPSTPEWSPAKPVVPLLREAVARARVPGLEAARER